MIAAGMPILWYTLAFDTFTVCIFCYDVSLFKGSVAGLPLICTEAEHQGIRLWAGPTSMVL
jgi:hypothetical protein